jgi:thymidylate kinase
VNLAGLVDSLTHERVIVFGSLPPEARDLDLLSRPEQARELAAQLAAKGFLEHGGEWVRFADCTVESLDLVATTEWRLGDDATERLFAEALPLEGCEHLARPSPAHLVLLVARHVDEDGGFLSTKRRAKIDRALAEDPHAWEHARANAESWNARDALESLQRAYREAQASEPRKVTRGHVVTFSGVDGSGKTSQIEALIATLERLGFEAVEEYVRIEWMTLNENRLLGLVAAPVKALLRLITRPRATTDAGPPSDPGRSLRRRSALVAHAWVLVVALAHARVQRGATRKHIAQGRFVICDRYTLDARVYLRYEYGRERRFKFQTWLLRRLSPQPLRSFYLDVPAETALTRKSEQYGLAELETLTELYREEHASFGAKRVDGERPQEELCAEIGGDVWSALRT